jgi:hypothetical protein
MGQFVEEREEVLTIAIILTSERKIFTATISAEGVMPIPV